MEEDAVFEDYCLIFEKEEDVYAMPVSYTHLRYFPCKNITICEITQPIKIA